MTAMTAPSASAGSDRQRGVIDDDHLSRMTLGDRRLEREVLEIFVRQTVIMLERIAGAEPALAAAAAHTLTGSARGIGAWRVARALSSLAELEAAPQPAVAATQGSLVTRIARLLGRTPAEPLLSGRNAAWTLSLASIVQSLC